MADVSAITAEFRGLNTAGTLGAVAIDGEVLEFPVVGYYLPRAGDLVRVVRLGREAYIIGPAVQKPAEVTVATVRTDEEDFLVVDVEAPGLVRFSGLRVFDSVADPQPGDVVSVDWAIGGVVVGRLSRSLTPKESS